MSSDAIVLLKNDHKEIRGVFRDFAGAGENATTRKGQLVDRMIELLTVHTYIENEVMDPPRACAAPGARGRRPGVLRGAPRGRRPRDGALGHEAWGRALRRQDHRAHGERRAPHGRGEKNWFPEVRDGLGRKTLQEIGAEMQEARKKAPTRPSQPSALKKTVDAVIR